MSEQAQAEGTQLPDNSLLEELDDFFLKIQKQSSNYQFVSVTERRCFNLAFYYLNQMDNLVSNNGLLLRYRELADYYQKNQALPKILLVDDILLHGRGMAKFLATLEALLLDELTQRGQIKDFSDFYQLHASLHKAIDITVYARNQADLILDDRFQRKLYARKKLYAGSLRNLSMQLSERLRQLNIANTSFVCSVRNPVLVDYLSNNGIASNSRWVPLLWNYCGETMQIYIRFHSNREKGTQRISTIRYFPNRFPNNTPQITSFSFLGDLSENAMQRLCSLLGNTLNRLGCPNLAKIMCEDKSQLRSSQGQLILYLVSMGDFWEFCNDVLPENIAKLKQHIRGDIKKIAVHFGGTEALRDELIIAISPKRNQLIMEEITPFMEKELGSIIQTTPENKLLPDTSELECEYYNDRIAETFYKIGSDAERKAMLNNDFTVTFSPLLYQTGINEENSIWKDGAISISKLWNYEEELTTTDSYQYIAALVALMDRGVLSVKCQQADNAAISMLARAGELSLAYFPQKLALFVPAFAEIERQGFSAGPYRSKAIWQFYNNEIIRNLDNPEIRKKFLTESTNQALEKLKISNYSEPWMMEMLERMYSSGQSFLGWNFENLTKQNDAFYSQVQAAAFAAAKNR